MTSTNSEPNVAQQISAVDDAAGRALDLVRSFAEQDPHDNSADGRNPWQNPARMFQQLDEARNEVVQAWQRLETTMQEEQKKGNQPASTTELSWNEQDLRAQFMDMVTDAFADVLNEMKETEQEIDLDVLVDCLQSGLDLLSQEDRELFMRDSEDLLVDDDVEQQQPAEGKLTPHEQRRRELGFHVETPTLA